MMAKIFLYSFFLFYMPLLCSGQSLQEGGYRLVWSDEFNKNSAPDSAVWHFEKGFVRNHEDQWYQPQNAYCKNGRLIIEAKRVHLPNPWYIAGSKDWRKSRQWINYTSASLNTSDHKSWEYGRFVMRAKIDTDDGLWPAFWTLGVNGQWPSNGEIDIMEYYRHYLLANIARGTDIPYKAKWFSVRKPLKSFGKDWSKHFHTWRMDWDSSEIKLYVDNMLMNEVPLDSLTNPDGINPFRRPHYILINMAVGGDNGGDPQHTKFPAKYEIDYIRIYQKK
ncbi:MAG: glycoside hydrolase family 16 protein [Chitinophagaceae bacterium]